MIILIFCSTVTFGQDMKQIEQDLIMHFESGDSLFYSKLLEYLSNEPLTLTYDFAKLKKKGVDIATSADNKFRIYSWDNQSGGSMHYFSNLYQYRSGTKVQVKKPAEIETEGGDAGGFYSEIFTLDPKKNIYIGYSNSIYSNKDCAQGIKIFAIENNGLNDSLKLIKTRSGLNNTLNFGFDFFSVVDRPERPIKLIYYDDKTKIVKIPVVDEDGKVTSKFIIYQYTGKYFERVR